VRSARGSSAILGSSRADLSARVIAVSCASLHSSATISLVAPQRHPRILVTRSPHQSSELATHLSALDLEPVLVPAIELAPPSSFDALDGALAELSSFHWLIFTSANAVEALHRRMEAAGLDAAVVQARIAAIGPTTARALESIGLATELIPPQAVAESLTEALLPRARQPDGSPARFLLARAEDARDVLPEALRAAGAEVTIAAAYRTVVPAGSIDAVRALFGGVSSDIAAVTFTSSSTARNLLALCEAAGVAIPPSALRVSIGPITSETLRSLGYPPHAEAVSASVAALAEAVREAIDSSPATSS
jgi:uroporphyrinogen-III synthase